MVDLHARTEPYSRYAIFFIQSGAQVKNIVLNIILQTTQSRRGYFHSRHASAPGELLSGVSQKCASSLVITTEFEQWDHHKCRQRYYFFYRDVRSAKWVNLKSKLSCSFARTNARWMRLKRVIKRESIYDFKIARDINRRGMLNAFKDPPERATLFHLRINCD